VFIVSPRFANENALSRFENTLNIRVKSNRAEIAARNVSFFDAISYIRQRAYLRFDARILTLREL